MRILFLHTYPLWGSGSGTYVRHLAQELAKKHKIAITCPDDRTLPGCKIYPIKLPFFVAATGHPEYPGCKLYHGLSNRELLQIYSTFLRGSIRAVERFKPEIIHVQHCGILSWVARFIKAIYGINYIVTSHGTGLHTISQDKRFWPLTREALLSAKCVTAVSGDTRAWVLKTFGFDKNFSRKMRTIPGGISIENYPREKPLKIINKKYKLKKKKVVLFAGKLTSLKGVKYLVKAARKIKGSIFIIGQGPEESSLKKLAKDLKLKNIHFLGYFGKDKKNELMEFYYGADVFVAPSVWDEPLGLVILEAMACKTPVVVTRKGGIPLAVKEGFNGLFIRPRNSNDLAEKINKILRNAKLRKRLGENARKTVEEKFTWKKISKKFYRIYKKFIINNKR